jgi:uncharacterized membrane protein (UPF0127 family)
MALINATVSKVAVAVSIVGLFFFALYEAPRKIRYQKAFLGETPMQLEFALTPLERYTGLSKRSSLCDQCGLLFLFPDKDTRTFVMRQMNFPLDIIWLDEDRVIGFSKNLAPEEEPYTPYRSPRAVNAVLEVPAGFVDQTKIKLGDALRYE